MVAGEPTGGIQNGGDARRGTRQHFPFASLLFPSIRSLSLSLCMYICFLGGVWRVTSWWVGGWIGWTVWCLVIVVKSRESEFRK